MQACYPYRTPALNNHRDDKAPDGEIKNVLIVICYRWTNSIAKASKNFGRLYRPTGPLCVKLGDTVKIYQYKGLSCEK